MMKISDIFPTSLQFDICLENDKENTLSLHIPETASRRMNKRDKSLLLIRLKGKICTPNSSNGDS